MPKIVAVSRRRFVGGAAAAAAGVALLGAGCAAPPPEPPAGRPGPANTGVRPGRSLRRHDGDLRVTTAGQVLEDLDIFGFVRISAPGVTMRNCRVRGGPYANSDADPRGPVPTGGWAQPTLLFCPDAQGLLVEDCTLVPDAPSFWITGLKGYGFTARRVNIAGVVDTVMTYGDDCRIEASWLHDHETGDFDPRGRADGPSHSDGVQVQGGRNTAIVGNSITGAYNAPIQVTQDYAKTDDLLIDGNYMDGGGVCVNIAQKSRPAITGVRVTNNRFGRNQRVVGTVGLYSPATGITQSGNVWDDDGTAVSLRRGA